MNLVEMIFDEGGKNPSKVAIKGLDFCYSYREVAFAISNRYRELKRINLNKNDTVAIFLNDGPLLYIYFYAIMAVGAIPVVLNPKSSAELIEFYINDLQPKLLISEHSIITQNQVQKIIVESDAIAEEWKLDCELINPVEKDETEILLIQYTSGSTGQPKGVIHTNQSVSAFCTSFALKTLQLKEEDIIYSVPKSFFGFGMGNSLLFPVFMRCTTVLDPKWPQVERIIRIISEANVTVFFGVPTIYREISKLPESNVFDKVRICFAAGAPLSYNIVCNWAKKYNHRIYNGIGSTELGHVFASNYNISNELDNSCGVILTGWQYKILDVNNEPVSPGEKGVLLVKGKGKFKGYWKGSGFEYNKITCDEWYRTGDIFSIDKDQGTLMFHGREDDRFKVKGRWVNPIEIEHSITSSFPEVGECYTCPIEDAEGDQQSVLIVHGDTGEFDYEMQLRSILHNYQRPSLVIHLEQIPKNSNGKPDRSALREIAQIAFDADLAKNNI